MLCISQVSHKSNYGATWEINYEIRTIFVCLLIVPFHLSVLKDALSGLRQFLATEKSFKMMENAFYFTLKTLFVLKIFNFLS